MKNTKSIKDIIKINTIKAIKDLYGATIPEEHISLQQTRKDVKGDITLVVFRFLKASRKSPENTAKEIGEYLKQNVEEIQDYSTIQGFLNIEINSSYWINLLSNAYKDKHFGTKKTDKNSPTIMIEYSSPNTNKPLHLGHIRNNLLGYSIAQILKADGNKVVKVNLVNDRGIHICKSMLAWLKYGENITPESSSQKGDHLVGDFYVKFDKEYKKQIKELIEKGQSQKEAEKNATILLEAQEMLRKWEAKEPDIYSLWQKMNAWVYKGFDETYKKLGVDFDKIYYESETYLLGKETVIEGLNKKILGQKEDKSVWCNLTAEGLDEKLLLRSDGTSVYMTQDIGTAQQRHKEYNFDKLIYVVGNEQDYHFKVLSVILKKLGFDWYNKLYHLSYGMVDLPSGKMKSREGTVVDADDLIEEMEATAKKMSEKLGKLENYSEEEASKVYHTIAMGALKYFILKVDPKKKMLFNPAESIDFNGNTGTFIQYTHARIKSVLRNAKDSGIEINQEIDKSIDLNEKEKNLLKNINEFPKVTAAAGQNLSPALIANYVYDLVKEYNQFYHDYSILKEKNPAIKNMRLILSATVANIIKTAMNLLGIDVPERM